MIFKPLSKRFFVDLLPEIQFNEDQVTVPLEVKSIKNLIRSEMFKSLSLKFLFFVKVIQGQCCISRG